MNVTFETTICAWDEKIPCTPYPTGKHPSLLPDRRGTPPILDKLRETTELDEFFHLRLRLTPFLVQPAHFQRKHAVHPKPVIHCNIFNPLIHK